MKSKFRDILSKSTEHNLESTEKDVTEKEFDALLSKLKKCKAPGWDLVQNEHIIFAGPVLKKVLLKLYSSIILHELVPHSWKQDII